MRPSKGYPQVCDRKRESVRAPRILAETPRQAAEGASALVATGGLRWALVGGWWLGGWGKLWAGSYKWVILRDWLGELFGFLWLAPRWKRDQYLGSCQLLPATWVDCHRDYHLVFQTLAGDHGLIP